MKTKTLSLMLLSLFFFTALSAQNYQLKFSVVNATGIDLYGVYVSESEDNSWGDDVIPSDLFDDGTTVEVTIPIEFDTMCIHDIKVTDSDGEAVVFPEIDFCEVSVLTFFIGSDGEVYYRTE
jgi:hypothetical protein